jgi:hypothetical protein
MQLYTRAAFAPHTRSRVDPHRAVRSGLPAAKVMPEVPRHLLLTAASAATAALILPPLGLYPMAAGCQAVAGYSALALGSVMAATLTALWSAKVLGHTNLLEQKWLTAAPQITMGLCFAPLLLMGQAALFGPGGVVMLGLAVGVTVYLHHLKTGSMGPSLTACVAMMAATCVLAPTGWIMAGGMSAVGALGQSLCGAAGLTTVAAMVVAGLRTVQGSAPTPLADSMQVPDLVVRQARLEGVQRGSEPASIFSVPQELAELTRELQHLVFEENIIFNGWRGICVATMYGPPGSGKTVSAAGLAQALDAQFIYCDNSSLRIDNVTALPEPYMNLVTLLLEAQVKASKTNQPVVILVDEVDSFLPRPTSENDPESFNRALGFTLLLNVMALLARSNSNLVLLMATNHPQRLKPLLDRMSERKPIYLGQPKRDDLHKMMTMRLRHVETKLKVRRIAYTNLAEHPRIASFIDRLFVLRLTGRALKAMEEAALNAANLADKAQRDAGQPPSAVDDAMLTAMDHEVTQLEALGPQNKPESESLPFDAEQSIAEMDELMQKMGLKDLDPFDMVTRLVERLFQTYVDPSQSVAMARLMSRFGVTLMQLGLVYAGQRIHHYGPQQLTDVHPDAGAKLFGGNDSSGKLMDILKATWHDYRHPEESHKALAPL